MREFGRMLLVMVFAALLVWVVGFAPELAWLLVAVAVLWLAGWVFSVLVVPWEPFEDREADA